MAESRILIWVSKDDTYYYHVPDDISVYAAALEILKKRIEQEFLDDDDEDYQQACIILLAQDGKKAWKLIKDRSDHGYEYEEVYFAGLWMYGGGR